MDFAFTSLDRLSQRRTEKWHNGDPDIIPLWVAESDFPTCPAIMEALRDAVDRECFGYPVDDGSLGKALSSYYARAGITSLIEPDWVMPLPDVVRGLILAVTYFTRPHSAVIVPEPAYPPFFAVPRLAGRETITITADEHDHLDLVAMEAAFKNGAGSVLLCNPHNPLGFTYTQEELAAIVFLASRYGARVISDEIHSPLSYCGHTMAAFACEQGPDTTITVTATSKAWNTAGLKCAQMILTSDKDRTIWRELDPLIKTGVSTLGLVAATAAYASPSSFVAEEIEYLIDQRDFLTKELSTRFPGIGFTVPNASYLMWLDFSGTALHGTEPAPFFLEEAKVRLSPGSPFGQGMTFHARLNYACSRKTLLNALDRMSKAWDTLQ